MNDRLSHRDYAALSLAVCAVLAGSGCASGRAVATPAAPVLTFEQKMTWILRLEEDRVLELAPPPVVASPPVVQGSGRGRSAVLPAPPPNPSLLSLLGDSEARIRRRAALATGRTRFSPGIGPLTTVLASDVDPEVRQMAAFALGLIGDASAAGALITALADADPLVQGRAAEGLGLINHRPAAAAVAAMMAAHTKSGALESIAADDLDYPKAPAVEAVRLGIYALVRLGAYDALASVLLREDGQPISRWWPVAYGFRRINDPRAGSALLALLNGDGTTTRAFAARGLGVVKDVRGVAPLLTVVTRASEPASVRIEAVRALAEIGAADAGEPLVGVATAKETEANLRLEVVTALGQLRAQGAVDLLLDLMTDEWPTLRAAAVHALVRTDPEAFLATISSLEPDRHWSVRAAVATALGQLDGALVQPRLLEMLGDADQRVVPAVLNALVMLQAASATEALTARLSADDIAVRQTAASGLARLKATSAVPLLQAAYERAEKDPAYAARAAILSAVVAIDPTAARPLLERAVADRDWAMRVRARQLLQQVAPAEDVAARIRPTPPAVLPELNDLAAMVNPAVSPVAYIETSKGTIQIELAVLDAPRTVVNFVSLVRRNFFGATPFHRIVPNFVVQDGDPRGDGEGGPGYTIRDEINQRPYLRGTVGMALDWEDTGGSQFFITHAPQPHLDGRYTVFGRVTAGMDVVDRLQQWDQIIAIRVWDGVAWIGPPR